MESPQPGALIDEAAADRELLLSKEVLETRLSARISAVAYPWGKLGRHVTERTFAAAARAGYTLGGFSLPRAVRDSDDLLRIPRFGVGSEPVESLAGKVEGRHRLARGGARAHPRSACPGAVAQRRRLCGSGRR